VTNSAKVRGPEWAKWAAGRIDEIQSNQAGGLKIVAQAQHFGGADSAFARNGADGQTSYAWRDTTLGLVMDIFHDGTSQLAEAWQRKNDADAAKFGFLPRRLIWASYEVSEAERDMQKVWQFYTTQETWDRLCEIKRRADPHNVFTPNRFSVVGNPSGQSGPRRSRPLSLPPQPDTSSAGVVTWDKNMTDHAQAEVAAKSHA